MQRVLFLLLDLRLTRVVKVTSGTPIGPDTQAYPAVAAMIPVGYMYKRVASKPDLLQAEGVADIYSLSHYISEDFADYVNFWRHNGYWLFDSPLIIEELSREEGIDLSDATPFYYEAYDYEYDEDTKTWAAFSPEPDFVTNVRVPQVKRLEGFDVATFSVRTSPECSPLSCCCLATELSVNEHCLFHTLEEAREALESGAFDNSEPGPYRIFAVYTVGVLPSAA